MAAVFFICLAVVSWGVGAETKPIFGWMTLCGVIGLGIITDRIRYTK